MHDQTKPIHPRDDLPPIGNFDGLRRYWRSDLLSGFLVFLIALPLCLGISLASGFPPIAGIFTAIVGALVVPWISNSELTIKGPAAGLIVIVVGAVEAFGGDGPLGGFTTSDHAAYRMVLAVGVVAAILQIGLGLLRAGILGELFPLAAVHGMLAAIGVIIMVKQFPVALGVSARGEPWEMLLEIPKYVTELNPAIALIGLLGIAVMFLWPLVQGKVTLLRRIPSQLVVLLVTVPLGTYLDLLHPHTYVCFGKEYALGEMFLVNMPDRIFGMFDLITYPDFGAFTGEYRQAALGWTMMFFLIGSLESLLSAKAVDMLDPWHRRANLDRDLLAVGTANLVAAGIGGLPMISEIVRSRANIDNGAKTRFSNMWHGVFLLICVALLPTMLHRIPLAALASMLLYTGFRLAHPREFVHVYHIGKEQLVIFTSTLIGVLATDLLIGIFIGIGVKLAIHLSHGIPLRSLWNPELSVESSEDGSVIIRARHSAIFTNWLAVRRKIHRHGIQEHRNVTLDLSECRLVDHSVMTKLQDLQREFEQASLHLNVLGLENHRSLSDHHLSARKRG